MAVEAKKLRETLVLAAKAVFWLAVVGFLIFYGTFLRDQLLAFFSQSAQLQKAIPVILNGVFLIGGTEVFLLITRFIIGNYLVSRGREKETGVLLALYTYVVWAITAIILASTFFKDFGALITSLGLIGFGITFALQKPILNFVGWLNIIFTSPFGIGDRVEIAGIRGDVLSIHTMYTRVQGTLVDSHTKAEKIITIPNEIILTSPTINYSRLGDIASDSITVSITYESNWRKAIHALEKAAEEGSAKFIKNSGSATKNEKKGWKDAIDLLQEASTKLRKGFLKQSLREQISQFGGGTESIYGTGQQKPKITMSLGASSIDLEAIYQTDIRSQRATRHEIARLFMEEAERSDDIELAYPHMQIVYDDKPRPRGNRKIGQWTGK